MKWLGYMIVVLGVVSSIVLKNITPALDLVSLAFVLFGFSIIWRHQITLFTQPASQCEHCWKGAKIGGGLLAGVIILMPLLSTYELSDIWRFLLVIISLVVTISAASLIVKYSTCVQFYKKLGNGPR